MRARRALATSPRASPNGAGPKLAYRSPEDSKKNTDYVTIATIIVLILVLIVKFERLPVRGGVRGVPSVSKDDMLATEPDGSRYQVVFSTDCTRYHDVLSYLLYFSALKVEQRGHVTRIVSGCQNKEDEERVRKWFQDDIMPMSKRFKVHFTPPFDTDANGERYEFFNKPFGMRHWLADDNVDVREDDIVILLDPDMMFMRPIVKDFSDKRETIMGKKMPGRDATFVKHGLPFAQTYGFGDQWRKLDIANHVGAESPARKVTEQEAVDYYPAGPPYLATGRDMKAIAGKWAEIVRGVHKEHPDLMAEMYAYCIAAAHLELPHQMIESMMVSDTHGDDAGGEGWDLLKTMPQKDICEIAANPDHGNPHYFPSVLHSCQDYSVGEKWYFQKREIPHDFFTCDSPLLEEPPANIATKYDYKVPPHGKKRKVTKIGAKKESFMVCALTSITNEASLYYKKQHCGTWSEKRMNFYKKALE